MPRRAYHEPSAERQVAGLGLPAEQLLRERRPQVRRAALGGEEHDPARAPGVPIRPGRGVPGGPASDDEQADVGHASAARTSRR